MNTHANTQVQYMYTTTVKQCRKEIIDEKSHKNNYSFLAGCVPRMCSKIRILTRDDPLFYFHRLRRRSRSFEEYSSIHNFKHKKVFAVVIPRNSTTQSSQLNCYKCRSHIRKPLSEGWIYSYCFVSDFFSSLSLKKCKMSS